MNISGMAGFSRRELRVIALLGNGSTTQEIAAKLGVKLAVVHNYIYFVYRKAGFNTRAALIDWAKDNGLDDLELVAPGTPYVPNRKMRGFFGRKVE
jgi:DNA-binding CsgD family transcriptional regulator